jgi:hypothetical protein
MKTKDIIILYTIVVVSGTIMYFVEHLDLNKYLLYAFVFSVMIAKMWYFMVSIYKKLVHFSKSYFRFLFFISMNILLMVISFAVDYYCIYLIDVNSFSGLEDATTLPGQLFKFFYLSFLLFTNMGVANVVPVSMPAECMVMFEAIVSFMTIIFILSDFVSLKESLLKRGAKKRVRHYQFRGWRKKR